MDVESRFAPPLPAPESRRTKYQLVVLDPTKVIDKRRVWANSYNSLLNKQCKNHDAIDAALAVMCISLNGILHSSWVMLLCVCTLVVVRSGDVMRCCVYVQGFGCSCVASDREVITNRYSRTTSLLRLAVGENGYGYEVHDSQQVLHSIDLFLKFYNCCMNGAVFQIVFKPLMWEHLNKKTYSGILVPFRLVPVSVPVPSSLIQFQFQFQFHPVPVSPSSSSNQPANAPVCRPCLPRNDFRWSRLRASGVCALRRSCANPCYDSVC